MSTVILTLFPASAPSSLVDQCRQQFRGSRTTHSYRFPVLRPRNDSWETQPVHSITPTCIIYGEEGSPLYLGWSCLSWDSLGQPCFTLSYLLPHLISVCSHLLRSSASILEKINSSGAQRLPPPAHSAEGLCVLQECSLLFPSSLCFCFILQE